LLHGHPETHVAWCSAAGKLAEQFAFVLTDLRGYGDGSEPEGGQPQTSSKQWAMAAATGCCTA